MPARARALLHQTWARTGLTAQTTMTDIDDARAVGDQLADPGRARWGRGAVTTLSRPSAPRTAAGHGRLRSPHSGTLLPTRRRWSGRSRQTAARPVGRVWAPVVAASAGPSQCSATPRLVVVITCPTVHRSSLDTPPIPVNPHRAATGAAPGRSTPCRPSAARCRGLLRRRGAGRSRRSRRRRCRTERARTVARGCGAGQRSGSAATPWPCDHA